MQTSTFDLLYIESDPRTELPSACICIRPAAREDYAGVSADRLISAHCMTFVELDAIRARAKSKFYKAYGCSCA